MKKILISTFVATALFLSFATPASAVYIPYIPPSSSNDDLVTIPDLAEGSHLVDAADILSPTEEEQLEELLVALETNKSVDAAILTVPTHGTDETIVEYSRRAAGTWELGSQVNNRGIIVVVAMNERRVRLAVGSGLQSSINEDNVQSIIKNDISPELSNGNFAVALTQGINRIDELAEPYNATATTEQNSVIQDEATEESAALNSTADGLGSAMWSLFGIIFGIVIVTIIIISVLAGIGKKKLEKLKAKHEEDILAAKKEAKNFYNMLSFSEKDALAAASPKEKAKILTAKLEDTKAKGKSNYAGNIEAFVDAVLNTSNLADSSSKFSNANEPDLIDKALAAKVELLKNKANSSETKKKHVKTSDSNKPHEPKENKGFKGFDNDSFTSGGFDVDDKLSNFSSFKDSKFNNGKSTSGF